MSFINKVNDFQYINTSIENCIPAVIYLGVSEVCCVLHFHVIYITYKSHLKTTY